MAVLAVLLVAFLEVGQAAAQDPPRDEWLSLQDLCNRLAVGDDLLRAKALSSPEIAVIRESMTNSKLTVLTLLLAFALGCVAHAVTSHSLSRAQGVQAQAVQAQPAAGIYNECTSFTLHMERGRSVDESGAAALRETVRVPAGWHVVGGGGLANGAILIVCR